MTPRSPHEARRTADVAVLDAPPAARPYLPQKCHFTYVLDGHVEEFA
jgi:hypothetical protein